MTSVATPPQTVLPNSFVPFPVPENVRPNSGQPVSNQDDNFPGAFVVSTIIIITATPTLVGETPPVVVITSVVTNSIAHSSLTLSSVNRSRTSLASSSRSVSTSTMSPTLAASSPSTALSSGAIIGISVVAVLGAFIIAIAAYLLGFRARRTSTKYVEQSGEHGDVTVTYKAKLDGQGSDVAELDGQGVVRWWSKSSNKNVGVKARARNETEPHELPAEGVKAPASIRELWIREQDLPELRTIKGPGRRR